MRINRKTLSLIVASLCGTGSSAIALGQDHNSVTPLSSVGRIGDGGVAAPSRPAPTAGPVDSRPAAFRSNVVADGTGPVARPTSGTYYDPTFSMASYSTDAGDAGYSVPCGDSCGSSGGTCCGAVGGAGLGFPSNASSGWVEGETLLWWAQGYRGERLVIGSNTTTNILDRGQGNTLAGGPDNPVGNDMLVGFRLNAGKWLDCNQNFGVGGRTFGIISGAQTTTYTNNGNSLGIPFFNTSLNQPDTYLINLDTVVNGSQTGNVQVRSDLDLIAGELYGRALLARDGASRVDLLGGYTFVRLDSELGLRTQYTDGITNLVQNGTVITTQDTFNAKNQFHGGHIGLLNELNKGRFSFQLMGKVALGNMEQTTSVSGSYREALGNNVFNDARGLFAQRSNIGVLTRNQFTFLPEAGAKIKYQLGNAQLGVGYTLLVFPSVVTAGNQIDPNIDIVNIAGVPSAPGPKFSTDTFFLHGLDLGVTFKF